jgi:hypothetical protein
VDAAFHADLVAEDVVIVEIKDEITRIVHRLKNDLSRRRQDRKDRSGPATNESPSDSPKFPSPVPQSITGI